MGSQFETNLVVTPSDFFCLRSPLLPFEAFLNWGKGLESASAGDGDLETAVERDRARLRDTLQNAIEDPLLSEAIHIASSDLAQPIERWRRDPDSKKGRRTECTVSRYFARMAGRPTPFGLFSGVSLGTAGEKILLQFVERNAFLRATRLDMGYLCSLVEALERDTAVRSKLSYRPNNSLYLAAARLRYSEGRQKGAMRSYHLIAVDPDEYLLRTIRRAEGGATIRDLVDDLVAFDSEIERDEAYAYVSELIDSQILVSTLEPSLTAGDGIEELLASFPSGVGEDSRTVIEEIHRELRSLDAGGSANDPARYRRIAEKLKTLPGTVDRKHLFQVDLFKPVAAASLSPSVLEEIARGVKVLLAVDSAWRRNDPMEEFRAAFLRRYEDREVPLLEALDEEVGIGFQSSGQIAEAGPILDGLPLERGGPPGGSGWAPVTSILLGKYRNALLAGEREIELTDSDLNSILALAGDFGNRSATSLGAIVSLAAPSEEALRSGQFAVVLKGLNGPSAARLFGRFCHLDAETTNYLNAHLREEEAASNPDAVFAEIVHLPEGRIGNIASRPAFRSYEIPYLGQGSVAPDHRIPLSDLRISVRADRIVLRSVRLGKEIVPRLSCAHNYRTMSVAPYRFLATLQAQDSFEGTMWQWGQLANEPFLPRVRYGRTVLSPARWTLDSRIVSRFRELRGADLFGCIREWRHENGAPRIVLYSESDLALPVDLENILSIEAFVDLLKPGKLRTVLEEMLPAPEELCASGPEGRFTHELVVPLIVRPEKAAEPARAMPVTPVRRSFAPGSEWLYFNLYTGTSTADRILVEALKPALEELSAGGAFRSWFFLRYGDPDWHLRIRFHGNPEKLLKEVLPEIHRAVAPLLRDGRVRKVQLDTYESEVARYGGPEAIAIAEEIFHADSIAVLQLLESLAEEESPHARWRTALYGCHRLLVDLGFDLEERSGITRNLAEGYALEFQGGKPLRIGLGNRFREDRRALTALLDGRKGSDALSPEQLAIFDRRSAALTPRVARFREMEEAGRLQGTLPGLAGSFLHMHVNRLLRSAHREQETVIHDFLRRLYESQAARARKKSKAAAPVV